MMSNYTVQLRNICESFAGDVTASSPARKVDAVINASHSKIFDFDYPIFDGTYKEHLEKKILRHFYFREIGCETYGQWQVQLDAKMNEIMPYYNQLYASENLVIDPLLSYREHSEQITNDDRTTQTADSGHDEDVFGDTVTDTFGKTVTNSGTDTDRYNDTVTDTFGKTVTNSGTDTDRYSDTVTDTFGKTVTNSGTDRDSYNDTVTDTFGKTVTNSGTDTDRYNDTVTDTFGKVVTDGGSDSNKFTPGVSDTVQRTPNLTHTRTGSESDNTTDTQTVAATHGQTNWDITSDTPQGGLTNIVGSGGSAVSTPPGTPQGGLKYASQIAEHTVKSEDNSGASTHNTTRTYNSVQDKDTGSDTTVTSRTGFDKNESTYGKTVTDSGSQSQAHSGNIGHEHGHKITDGGTQTQAHTGNVGHEHGHKITDGGTQTQAHTGNVGHEHGHKITDGGTQTQAHTGNVGHEHGHKITDGGTQSQEHTGNVGHEHGHKITDGGTQTQAHTGTQKRNYGKIVDGTDNFDGSVTVDRSGFTSGQHELLKQYRENMLNIDMMVINEMNELFMGLYDF